MTSLWVLEVGAAAGAIMAVVGLATWVVKTLKKISVPLQGIKSASVSSLRYSIVLAHREYKQNGVISRMALECVCDMYAQYINLGGNGFIVALMEELKRLPIDSSS